MKEELKNLKELVKEYNELSDTFSAKRSMFNIRVHDLCKKYDCIIYPGGLSQEELEKLDYYEMAKLFFNGNASFILRFNNIRKLNSDADRRRLFTLYVRCLTKNYNLDYDTAFFLVNNYMILDEAGYYDIVEAEYDAEHILKMISAQTETLKAQGLESIEKTVEVVKKRAISAGQVAKTKLDPYATEAKTRLEPYTSEVKKGFNSVMDKAKPFVHDGSKELAKVFTKIADRTRPNDNEKKND